ncbi:MAG: L,D-transpeptidase family protein [Pseudomonadota bacterium]
MSNRPGLFMRQGALLFLLLFTLATPVMAEQATNSVAASNYAAQNYARLQAELPYYQAAANHPDQYPWPIIPHSERLLRPGVRDAMVLLLKQRLRTTRDLVDNNSTSLVFDKELTKAVKIFQARHGLTADAIVGADTLAALNVTPDIRVKQIQINMQRFLQLEHDLGDRFVLINIPEYQLHLIEADKEVLNMKIVVGKPTRETPELSSEINRVIFNPHWSVPHLIAQNDIVPKVIENPSYLNENKIRIFNNQESDAYEMSTYDVDWRDAEENGFQYHLRQDPGVKNALGLVKFEFQNSHDVYLHDTPAKELFNKDKRDFSSGCIRLEKPFALVAYLTQNDDRIDSTKIRTTLESRHTTYFSLHDPIPIFITYITAWVSDDGIVHFADDVYGKDFETAPVMQQSSPI